jgi:hypothetical protein
VSQRTVRAPRIARNLSTAEATKAAEPFDLKPYAAGFFAGAMMFGLGRYISISNTPKEEVLILIFCSQIRNKFKKQVMKDLVK